MKGDFAAVIAELKTFSLVCHGVAALLTTLSGQLAVQCGIIACQVIQQPRSVTEPCLVGLIPASLITELLG